MSRRRRLGPHGGGGHRGHFPSLEDTGGLSPGWGLGRESNNHYGRASPGTQCHTAEPSPRAQTSLHPAVCPPAGGCPSQGDQGLTGSNSLGIPRKGLQDWADLSHWLRVHICTPSQDEISETTGLLIRRLDWQSSRPSPCPRERAGQVSAPISNSDPDSQEAGCHPSRLRGPTTPSFLKWEDGRCSGSGTGQQDRTSFCGAQPWQAGGYHPPVVPFLFSLGPSSLVTMSGLGRGPGCVLSSSPPHPIPVSFPPKEGCAHL